jgi:hypothetical protein
MSRRFAEEELRDQNSVYTSVTTIMWNMTQNNLPSSIVGDFDTAIDENRLPRFDYNQKGKSVSNNYRSQIGSQAYEFANGTLAPPSGPASLNYAQYVNFQCPQPCLHTS